MAKFRVIFNPHSEDFSCVKTCICLKFAGDKQTRSTQRFHLLWCCNGQGFLVVTCSPNTCKLNEIEQQTTYFFTKFSFSIVHCCCFSCSAYNLQKIINYLHFEAGFVSKSRLSIWTNSSPETKRTLNNILAAIILPDRKLLPRFANRKKQLVFHKCCEWQHLQPINFKNTKEQLMLSHKRVKLEHQHLYLRSIKKKKKSSKTLPYQTSPQQQKNLWEIIIL